MTRATAWNRWRNLAPYSRFPEKVPVTVTLGASRVPGNSSSDHVSLILHSNDAREFVVGLSGDDARQLLKSLTEQVAFLDQGRPYPEAQS